MNARWMKFFVLSGVVFFLMSSQVSAKPMPEKPTWDDVRQELRKVQKKHHAKHIKKQDVADRPDMKLMHDPRMKPIQDDDQPPRRPILDPKASPKGDPKGQHPGHRKGSITLTPDQLKKLNEDKDHPHKKPKKDMSPHGAHPKKGPKN